jgi:hypothetical protein
MVNQDATPILKGMEQAGLIILPKDQMRIGKTCFEI